jgi:hypothetical protein
MTEPLSLGDILEQALLASAACQPEPPPLVASDEDDAVLYMRAAGWVLALDIAQAYPISFADAWDALCHVPDEMLPLLETPSGWAILADHVARDLGIVTHPPFTPTTH